MFTGRTALSLDAKGRIAIPTRFRESLQPSAAASVVLTQHPMDRCLALYPQARWEEIAAQIAGLPDALPSTRGLKRRFIGQAVWMELDSNGRILIPVELRELAGLDKTVMLVGQMSRFEIWSNSEWQRQAEVDYGAVLSESINTLAF